METIRRIWSRIAVLTPFQAGLIVFIASLIVRVGLVFATGTYRELSRFELERTALSLAKTGVYGNPYNIPTGPTAHVSPGYTVMLAAIFRLFGDGYRGEIVKDLWASITTSLQFALLPWVSQKLRFGVAAGFLGGMLSALLPLKFLMQVDGDWEATYTGIFLLLTIVLTTKLWRGQALRVQTAVLNGAVWGLALLFASVILPIWAACLVMGFYFRRAQWRQYVRFAVVEAAIVVLLLSPWMIRNKMALGALIPTRSNLGIELRVSNNDYATPDQRVNYLLGVYDRYHPLQNRHEAELVKKLGEVEYNRRAERQARQWIATHPRRYWELTLGRFIAFWFYPDPRSNFKTVFLAITGVLGVIGAVLILRRDLAAGVAICFTLLLYPAPSYLIHVGLRQRYPIDSLLCLLSVVCVMQVWEWSKHRSVSGQKETEAAKAASVRH